jgi:hypothetical protein
MLRSTQSTKTDPIFAAIEAHRQANAALTLMLEEDGVTDDALNPACEAERTAAIELTNIPATTIAGLMAVTVYVSSLTNRGYDWTICGDLIDEDAGDTEPRSFEACLIRNLAVALAQINGVTAISVRS